jgi:hypothetical protein
LDDWLSVEDVFDLLEIATIDAHNTRLIHKQSQKDA